MSSPAKFIDDWTLESNWQPARRALAACTHLETVDFVVEKCWDVEQIVLVAREGPHLVQRLQQRVAYQLPEMFSAGKLRFLYIE